MRAARNEVLRQKAARGDANAQLAIDPHGDPGGRRTLRSMKDATRELGHLLVLAKARVTFDSERDITKPCFNCGEAEEPRRLVEVGVWTRRAGNRGDVGDPIRRPLCAACIRKGTRRRMSTISPVAVARLLREDLRRALNRIARQTLEIERLRAALRAASARR